MTYEVVSPFYLWCQLVAIVAAWVTVMWLLVRIQRTDRFLFFVEGLRLGFIVLRTFFRKARGG